MGRAALWFLVMVALTGVVLLPVYWMLLTAINGASIFTFPPHFWPTSLAFVNFIQSFTFRPFATWLINSTTVALGTTALSMMISLAAAYSLSRYPSRAILNTGFLILMGQMIPLTVLIIPLYIIFRTLGLINTLTSVILAATTFALPMCLWMLKGYLDHIPYELDEAALVDGCSPLQAYVRIVIPSMAPGIAASAAFSFMLGWNEFFFANTFLTTQNHWVATVGLDSYIGQYALQWGAIFASALMVTVPPAVLFFFIQRFMVIGLSQGAVKG